MVDDSEYNNNSKKNAIQPDELFRCTNALPKLYWMPCSAADKKTRVPREIPTRRSIEAARAAISNKNSKKARKRRNKQRERESRERAAARERNRYGDDRIGDW